MVLNNYNHKQAIEFIKKIENKCNVNSILFDGIKLWPLLRGMIWFSFMKGDEKNTDINTSIPNEALSEIVINHGILGNMCSFFRRKLFPLKVNSWLKKYNNYLKDFIFINTSDEYYFDGNLKIKNRHLDPLQKLSISLGYNTVKLYINRSGVFSINKISDYSVEMEASIQHCFKQSSVTEKKTIYEKIDGINVIEEINCILPANRKIEIKNVVQKIFTLTELINFFEKILMKSNSKIVFMTCYYQISNFALICVCKKKNIKTVDVQHGKQGKYHALYNHWYKLPEEGYELLPDYFWNWGEESRKNIEKYRPFNYRHHIPVIGGYLLLSDVININKYDIDEEFNYRLKRASKRILVSLQPGVKGIYEIIYETVKISPQDWFWLFRLHPYEIHKIKYLENDLLANNLENCEVALSSKLSLYSLLSRVDYHLTGWSSVMIEALAFNVPTIIISRQGYELYNDKIEEGVFWYADTAAAIKNNLADENLSVKEYAADYYFDLNTDTSREVLQEIANQQQFMHQ